MTTDPLPEEEPMAIRVTPEVLAQWEADKHPLPTTIAEEPSDLERAFRECLNAMAASYRACYDLLDADDASRGVLLTTLGDALDALIEAST